MADNFISTLLVQNFPDRAIVNSFNVTVKGYNFNVLHPSSCQIPCQQPRAHLNVQLFPL
jgi:hypothetical protein